jgi:tetratricopeptide (TPR) repeat protein
MTDYILQEGKALLKRGELDAALRSFTRAIEMDPDLTEAYFRRADTYFDNADYDKAVADYKY